MDAFFAAVEELDRPELRGKPLLIGHPGARSVVTTASYAARRFGVGSAMSMELARRRCPEALVIEPRFERYKELSRVVMDVFSSFTPLVEPLSLDEAFLDMSGASHLFGSPEEIGRKIKAEVFRATGGLRVSVGIATTKFVAKVASDHQKPDGLTIVEGDRTEAFLAPLPVRRLWGVGPKAEEKLRALGLRTIADVAEASPDLLRAALGQHGPHLIRLARGIDPREVVSDRETKSVGSEETLAEDVFGADAIRPLLRRESENVGRRLRKHGLRAKGVRVKLKTASFQLMSRQRMLPRHTDDDATIFAAASELLGAFSLDDPIRLVGVAAFELSEEAEPVQGELFPQAGAAARSPSLNRTLDELRDRFGAAAIRRASEIE